MPISPQITITPEDIATKNFDISAVTYTSTTATYTATGHTFSTGDVVLISDLAPDGYNGTFTITGTATNTFTVANTTNATVTDAVGNAFWSDPTEYSYENITLDYAMDTSDVVDITALKIQTYYALTPPSGSLNVGDLWFDTDDNNKQYRWDGSNWISVQDGTIATKNRTFYAGSAPTGTFTDGDIWFDTSTGNKPYRWNGSSWISVQDASIATALSTANAAQTSANGKNKVTYSASAASGSGTTAGDIWWQYSGGNIVGQWTWNGSSWVSNQITSTVIANLDAGKITAGTISVAISLEAATITGGSININSGTFVVTSSGAVTITAGSFNINSGTFQVSSAGAITASAGTIAGWTLASGYFTNSAADTFLYANPGSDGLAYSTVGRGIMRRLQLNGASGTTLGTATLAVGGNTTIDGTTIGSGNITAQSYLINSGIAIQNGTAVHILSGGRLVQSTSSERFKKNIVTIPEGGWLDKVLQIRPVNFQYDEAYTEAPDEVISGLIAEDIAEIPGFEHLLYLDPLGDPFSLSYERLTVFLVLAIKELKAEIDKLKGN